MKPKRIIFWNEKEVLSGVVQNKKASDIEERFARALAKIPGWTYLFRERISPLTHQLTSLIRNLPGELEIDFLLQQGETIIPVLIQGEIGHFYAAWQRTQDEDKIAAIDKALRAYGALPTVQIPQNRNDLWKLSNQEYTDRTVRELLL